MDNGDKQTFNCEKCKKTFSHKRYLTKHVARVHNEQKTQSKSIPVKLPCGLCDKVFTRLSHLQRHQLGHAKIRDFNCSFCGTGFIQKEHLIKHIRRKHSKQTNETVYSSKTTKERNIDVHQTISESIASCIPSTSGLVTSKIDNQTIVIHVCRYCGFAFTEKYLLQRHVQTVHQPFECECCKKVIYGKKNFAAHERKTRSHAHICKCGMSFDRISVYKNHVMACTRKCAFECMENDCGEAFAQRIQIDRHWLKKHYKPTICQFCDFLAEAPLRMSEHVTNKHQLNLCGYCGLHSPPPDHIALTHWRRLKRPKHKTAAKNPRTSEEKDVAAILSGFSTSGSTVIRNEVIDDENRPFARAYYKGFPGHITLEENGDELNNSSVKKEDDILPSDWFQQPSNNELLDLGENPFKFDSLLNESENNSNDFDMESSLEAEVSLDSNPEEQEEEEIVLHVTVALEDNETSIKIGERLPPRISSLFGELSQLDIRLLDSFPGSGRILSVHLPVVKPPNMNAEEINEILKSINL